MRLRACLAKVLSGLRCDARPSPIERALGPLSVSAGLVADGLQLGHALLEHRVRYIGDSVFDRVVQPLEFGFRFGCSPAQFGDVSCAAPGALFAAVEHARQDLLETLGL